METLDKTDKISKDIELSWYLILREPETGHRNTLENFSLTFAIPWTARGEKVD